MKEITQELLNSFRSPAFPGSYFLSFEGIEGAGKSTQIIKVKEYLEQNHFRVLILREPGGTPFGEKLRQAILETKNEITPLAEAHLFAASRAQLLTEVILKELAEPNTVVICDRYIDSSLVYQGHSRGYRGLTSVTNEPGRKVALLTEQARIEEEYSRITEPSGTSGGDLERVIAYLHEAYDAGIDQLRVVDEIIRITARYDRIPDCLAALEVKAEILELSSQQMTTQRRELLMDQVVAIRRLQAQLSRDRLSNTELAWQYLDKAQQKSPANPLLMPDLIALAEAQGRHSELAELLQTREDQLRAVRGDDAPQLLGLWLKRALALRSAGQDSAADELEQLIAAKAPSHLLLLLGRQRRALAKKDWAELAELLRQEAQLAEGRSTRDEPSRYDRGSATQA
jgi:hypothetical protein